MSTLPGGARYAIRPPVRRAGAVVSVLGLVLLVLPALWYGGETGPGRLDLWARSVVDTNLPADHDAALRVDWFGEPTGRLALVAGAAFVCLLLGRRRLALVAVAGIVITSAAAVVLKDVVGRQIHGEFLSYPSGHTAAIAAAGVVLGLLLSDLVRAWWPAAILLIAVPAVAAGAVMAWAQITLDAHYPTDTVGGLGAALVLVPATAWAVDRLAGSDLRTPRSVVLRD